MDIKNRKYNYARITQKQHKNAAYGNCQHTQGFERSCFLVLHLVLCDFEGFFFSDFICFVGDIIKQLESVWVWMCLKYMLTK